MLDILSSNDGLHFSTDANWFSHVNIFMKDQGGSIFGVKQTLEPYMQRTSNLRGLIQDVNVIGEQGRFKAHYATAVSPMFFNSLGYLSFFDTFSEGRYQFTTEGRTELHHASKTFKWHILDAPSLDYALTNYYSIIGASITTPINFSVPSL